MKKNESSQTGRHSQADSHVHKVHLSCHAPEAKAVFVAGTFNDWNPNTTPMLAPGKGQWAKELMLVPGRCEYRFVVDGEWVNDPKATEQVANPHGSFNSVLVVPAGSKTE